MSPRSGTGPRESKGSRVRTGRQHESVWRRELRPNAVPRNEDEDPKAMGTSVNQGHATTKASWLM